MFVFLQTKNVVTWYDNCMESELFKEHHPHKLSDYMSRGFVSFISRWVTVLAGKKQEDRATVAVSILSSLAMSLAYTQHLRAVELKSMNRDEIEDLLTIATGEQFHLLCFSKLHTSSSWISFVTVVLHGISSLVFRTFAVRAPRVAHRILGYAFEKAITYYSIWIEELVYGQAEIAAPKIACIYFELVPGATVVEMLSAIRNDCMRYRDMCHAKAEENML